jgi:hypothetical protein
MAFFMLVTSRLHVSGGVDPSSKKERGMVAAVGRLNVVLVKEVAAFIMGGWPREAFGKVSFLVSVLVIGPWPLIESMDAAGEIPLLAKDWRGRAYSHMSDISILERQETRGDDDM